jgi:ribose-phosphate pyrophosphokinase
VIERYTALLAESGSGDGLLSLENIDYQFANSETCVRLDRHVGGYDVFLFQSLCDPVSKCCIDSNYMAFLIAARTFREHGANHVTAVLPYLAYSRQDKPTEFMREPTTARLMADLCIVAGVDRLITWHPHCGQIRGFYGGISVNMLSSLSLFVEEFRRFQGRDDVIAVAPDAGASKLVMYFCQALGLKCAIGSKFRPRPDEAVIAQIVGDFRGKKIAIILDDELSTGGTIYNLVQKLVTEHEIKEVYFAVSHNRCVQTARDRLLALHTDYYLKEVIVTNSIPQTEEFQSLPFVSMRCLSDTLSRTINRIHYSRSVSEVFYRP